MATSFSSSTMRRARARSAARGSARRRARARRRADRGAPAARRRGSMPSSRGPAPVGVGDVAADARRSRERHAPRARGRRRPTPPRPARDQREAIVGTRSSVEASRASLEPGVRQARAGRPFGTNSRTGFAATGGVAAVGDERAGLVGEAELQAEHVEVLGLVRDRGADRGAAAGRQPSAWRAAPRRRRPAPRTPRMPHRVAQAHVGVVVARPAGARARRCRAARRRAQPGLDGGELPRQVVRVLHAGVEAEPAGRRESDARRRRPGRCGPRGSARRPARSSSTGGWCGSRTGSRRSRARGARCAAHAPRRSRRRALVLGIPGVHEDPGRVDVVRDEGAGRVRDRSSSRGRRGARRRAGAGWPRSGSSRSSGAASARPARCRATCAPRLPAPSAREQPAAADLVRPSPSVARSRDVTPSASCSRASHSWPRSAARPPARAQRVEQDRLEAVLRQVAQRRRRDREHVVVLALERQAAELLAGERRHPAHVPGVGGRHCTRRRSRVHVDAGRRGRSRSVRAFTTCAAGARCGPVRRSTTRLAMPSARAGWRPSCRPARRRRSAPARRSRAHRLRRRTGSAPAGPSATPAPRAATGTAPVALRR